MSFNALSGSVLTAGLLELLLWHAKVLSSPPVCGFPGLGVPGADTPRQCWSVTLHRKPHRERTEDFNARARYHPRCPADFPKVVQNRKRFHWLKRWHSVLFATGWGLGGVGGCFWGISFSESSWLCPPHASRISVLTMLEQHIQRVSYSLCFSFPKICLEIGTFRSFRQSM